MQVLPPSHDTPQRYCDAWFQTAFYALVYHHAPTDDHEEEHIDSGVAVAVGTQRYQFVWELLHKLRSVIGKCDDRYMLKSYFFEDCFAGS